MSKQYSAASSSYSANTTFSGFSGGPLTMHCWAKVLPNPVSIWNVPYCLGHTTLNNTYRLRMRMGIGLYFLAMFNGGAEVSPIASLSMANNVWYSCTGRVNSNTSREAIINGTIFSTVNTTSVTMNTLDTICVGTTYRPNFKGESHNGLVAYPAAWNVALSNDEIVSLSQGMSPLNIRPANLISYIPYLGRDTNEIDIISGGVLVPINNPTANNDVPSAKIMATGPFYYS